MKTLALFALIVSVVAIAATVKGAYSYSDDFQSYGLGSELDGQGGWTVIKHPAIPSATIVNTHTSTLNGQWVGYDSSTATAYHETTRTVAVDENLLTIQLSTYADHQGPGDPPNSGWYGTSQLRLLDNSGNDVSYTWFRTDAPIFILNEAKNGWIAQGGDPGDDTPWIWTAEFDFANDQQRITSEVIGSGNPISSDWLPFSGGPRTLAEVHGGTLLIKNQRGGIDDVSIITIPAGPKALAVTPDAATIFENSLSGPTSVDCAVTLTSAPTETVTVTGESSGASDPNAHITIGSAVSFDGNDWDSTKYITVSSINRPSNTAALNDHMVTFTTGSLDPSFDGQIEVTMLTVVADDIPAVLVDTDDGVEISEQGPTFDSYTVALLTPPVSDVTISPIASDPCQLTAAPVNIAAATWYDAATITVTAQDDDILEGDPHSDIISNLIMTDDPDYALVVVDNVPVSIRDNECGAWGYPERDYNLDCQVNLIDFGEFAADWLDCTDPSDPVNCYDAR